MNNTVSKEKKTRVQFKLKTDLEKKDVSMPISQLVQIISQLILPLVDYTVDIPTLCLWYQVTPEMPLVDYKVDYWDVQSLCLWYQSTPWDAISRLSLTISWLAYETTVQTCSFLIYKASSTFTTYLSHNPNNLPLDLTTSNFKNSHHALCAYINAHLNNSWLHLHFTLSSP